MTKPRRRHSTPIGLLFAALAAGCGGDVTLPGDGEAANLEILGGNEQLGPAGAALAQPILVRVTDTQERPVASQDVTFVIESGGGSVTPATLETNGSGQASAAWTLGPTTGRQLLRVRTARGGSVSPLEVTFVATALAGTGSNLLEVNGDEQIGPVNSALADSLVVRATDPLGNPVAGVEVMWAVSGGGSIEPATVVTGADGLAAAERVLGPTAGPQSAQAAVDGFAGSPVNFTHTAIPANPTELVRVSGDGQSAPGGFEVAQDLVVRLEDDNDNGIGGRAITWVVPAGSGSVNPVNTTTDANGLAATRWTLPSAVGSYDVRAVFSGLADVPFTGTATADVPTRLELVTGNNQSASVGASLPNPLVVRVTDANDNPVADVSVSWAAGVGGSVSAANSGTDASGLAQITRTLGTVPGPHTTTATVEGLSGSPITFNSIATVGPPAQLAIITQPGSPTISGNAFFPVPVIQVQDALGNSVGQGGIQITASITSGQVGASLENELRNTNASGRTIFTNLRITGPPDDDYVLTFTATAGGGPLIPVSSSPLSVVAGAASRIVILTQPSPAAVNGAVFAQQPVVQVQDGAGNPIPTAGLVIAASIQDGQPLLGPSEIVNATTDGTGTAAFANLRITGVVGNRTLSFSRPGLTAVESNQISITAGPPASIAIQPGTDDQSAPVGTAVPNAPAVLVADVSGNGVVDVTVTFAVTLGGGTVDPNPGVVVTGSNGIAAVTSWTLGPTAGPNMMTATASGLNTVTFDATASAATTTTSLSAEPASSVELEQVTFTANVTSGGGTPTGQVSFRDAGTEIGQGTLTSGVATFSTTVLTAATHPITAHYLGDGTFGTSASSTLNYTVAAANVAPSALADGFNVNEDATLTVAADGVLSNDTDADGGDLTAQPVAGPVSAQDFVLNSNGSFTYTPADDFNGSDSFSYQANDGLANSNIAAVTITIIPVNDNPGFTAGGDVSTSSLLTSVLGESHAGWASGISPGPPDESGQTVAFEISTDTDEAFQMTPQIDAARNLVYRPVLRLDTIVVTATVVARDSEGATSEPQTFTITINP